MDRIDDGAEGPLDSRAYETMASGTKRLAASFSAIAEQMQLLSLEIKDLRFHLDHAGSASAEQSARDAMAVCAARAKK